MNVFNLIDFDNSIGNSVFPFYFIKDNIIIANGKCGTKSIQSVCDRSWQNSSITSSELKSIVEQGYNLHLVIRNPISRFRSGILEDWCVNTHYINHVYDASKVDVDAFVRYRLSLISSSLYYSQEYHISNWLSRVMDVIEFVPTANYKIWELKELSILFSSLGIVPPEHLRSNDISKIKFLEKYDNLPKETTRMIDEYLESEMKIYNKLIEIREQQKRCEEK